MNQIVCEDTWFGLSKLVYSRLRVVNSHSLPNGLRMPSNLPSPSTRISMPLSRNHSLASLTRNWQVMNRNWQTASVPYSVKEAIWEPGWMPYSMTFQIRIRRVVSPIVLLRLWIRSFRTWRRRLPLPLIRPAKTRPCEDFLRNNRPISPIWGTIWRTKWV